MVVPIGSQTAEEHLRALYRSHQWFDLRATITNGSPDLMQGAVATAFNDPAAAEVLLLNVIRTRPTLVDADEAYGMLSQIYIRSGQYGRFSRNYRDWAARFPSSPELLREKENLQKFSGRPDQVNGPRRRAVLRHEEDTFSVPVTIDASKDDCLFDTGAWQSAMTDREASKLRLRVREGSATLIDASGTRTTFRTAVAKEVVIGAMTFRDVSFAVITGGPFADVEACIIGMPILLPARGLRWSKDGTIEFGGTDEPSRQMSSNLIFDRHRLLLRAEVLGRMVLTTLDTGATTTDLNANFADLFADFVARIGKKGTQDITGAGGTRTFESIDLPELVFTIGPTSVALRPAHVTLQRLALIGGECCVGNAGHDLLTQRQSFAIDFSTMTLRLQ
jgi:predicted aspartyl protease